MIVRWRVMRSRWFSRSEMPTEEGKVVKGSPFCLMKCSTTAKQIAEIPQAVNEERQRRGRKGGRRKDLDVAVDAVAPFCLSLFRLIYSCCVLATIRKVTTGCAQQVFPLSLSLVVSSRLAVSFWAAALCVLIWRKTDDISLIFIVAARRWDLRRYILFMPDFIHGGAKHSYSCCCWCCCCGMSRSVLILMRC